VWIKSRVMCLLVLFALFSALAWSEESSIDQALQELDNLEASLKQLDNLIDSLQTSLWSEQLTSMGLNRQIENLRSQLNSDKELLIAQGESLNQAEAALIRLERSLKLSKTLNKVFIPATAVLAVSTGILLYILLN
jgi:peptidoglycan hydrolase CwlO-like protein